MFVRTLSKVLPFSVIMIALAVMFSPGIASASPHGRAPAAHHQAASGAHRAHHRHHRHHSHHRHHAATHRHAGAHHRR